MVGRFHLFEVEDQPWCPSAIRDATTDVLRTVMDVFGMSQRLAPWFEEIVERVETRRIVDLCSGAGGPLPGILEKGSAQTSDWTVVLTDKYPNERSLARAAREAGTNTSWEQTPIDATDVPDRFDGLHTMFNALHHFRPRQVEQILQGMSDRNVPFLSVEFPGRYPGNVLGVLLVPLGALVVTPFIRPMTATRIMFTYVLPVIPAVLLWDGMISCLRVYDESELRDITGRVDGMHWEIGEWRPGGWFPGKISYLLGVPKTDD